MRRRRSSAHRELKHVKKKLEKLNHEKVATVDFVHDRLRVRQEITRTIQEFDLTVADAPAIDMIIDGHVAEWRQSVERHNHSSLAALDHLRVEVSALVDGLAERVQAEEATRKELDGVNTNLLDQVGEPERPRFGPMQWVTRFRR